MSVGEGTRKKGKGIKINTVRHPFCCISGESKIPLPAEGEWQAKPDGVGCQGNYYAEKKIKSLDVFDE
jgi:hypothetical protein